MFVALKHLNSAIYKIKATFLKNCEGYINWTTLTLTKSI